MILQQATSKQTKPFVIKHVSDSFDNKTSMKQFTTQMCVYLFINFSREYPINQLAISSMFFAFTIVKTIQIFCNFYCKTQSLKHGGECNKEESKINKCNKPKDFDPQK